MSKVLAGTAFVLLGGATATGGVFLYRNAKSSSGTEETKGQRKEEIDAELQKDLSTFKSAGKDKGCIKSLFPNLENIGTEEDSSTVVDKSFFTSGTTTTGCLVVNWDKHTKNTGGEEKWHGNFRLLWAVKGEKKGFIVFLAGKTPSTAGKQEIQWEAGIYKLEEITSEPNKWKAKKQQEVTSGTKTFKKENGNDASQKFPQPGTALKTTNDSSAVPSFWGLMTDVNALTKIETSTAEGTAQSPTSSLRAYWSWKSQTGSDKKKLSDWSKDWDKWWNDVFDNTKFKAKELGEAHQGDWKQEKYDPAPKTNAGGSSGG